MSDEETFRCAYCGRKYETRKAAKKCERADIELMMSANPNSGGGRGFRYLGDVRGRGRKR